ncbi:MAG: sigma-54 dependent transcriptional regulator [Gemmatimonadetes bacterium]|jgi:two-component system nitrogen regulation response regulator NtrX|nr:sigma-54 dependent transcriptional regulator [Gemmatimonadota bacterium]|tara:strand:- start:539 stop:1900 length:1362 start_codon:yes stop_codon:yes gene_type:complete
MARLMVVDDEKGIREALVQVFEYDGHQVRAAEDGPDALLTAESFHPDVIFLDVKMPGMDGLDVLARLHTECPGALVVMISGHGTIETAIEATRAGAYDFLEKPLDTDRLLVTLGRALELKGLTDSIADLKSQVESRYEIIGTSYQVRQVLDRVERVAPTEARVLVTGENGTGKELVARAIHRLSSRSDKAFVEVNCAAIPSELIESALFGHMKGSFTGAVADREGKFEQAHGGTLFLDEIGDMSLEAQAKVLRVLEQGVLTRVGGSKSIEVDVRVIAATNKDLEQQIEVGAFREDLFYRLNVVPIQIPALRERREDVPMLISHFCERMANGQGVVPKRFSSSAVERLQGLPWPGNVRELRNTVERLLILSTSPEVGPDDVDLLASGRSGSQSMAGEILGLETFVEFKESAERAYIVQKLRENEWNVAETARRIEMPRSNLYKKIERYGLVRDG